VGRMVGRRGIPKQTKGLNGCRPSATFSGAADRVSGERLDSMSDEEGRATHWFTLVYQEFLLRDIFGKVVPGMLVIVSLFVVGTDLSTVVTKALELPWWLWGIAIGPAWLFGFAVQSLGEMLWFLRYFPAPAANEKEEEHFKKMYRELREFWSKGSPRDQRHLERFVVIKEACGIGACGLGLSLVLLGANDVIRVLHDQAPVDPHRVLIAIALAGCVVSLGRMHRCHIFRQKWFQEVVLQQPNPKAERGKI